MLSILFLIIMFKEIVLFEYISEYKYSVIYLFNENDKDKSFNMLKNLCDYQYAENCESVSEYQTDFLFNTALDTRERRTKVLGNQKLGLCNAKKTFYKYCLSDFILFLTEKTYLPIVIDEVVIDKIFNSIKEEPFQSEGFFYFMQTQYRKEAINNNNIDLLIKFSKTKSFNNRNIIDLTHLYFNACKNADYNSIKKLIENGININELNKYDESCLYLLFTHNNINENTEKIFSFLLENNINTEFKSKTNYLGINLIMLLSQCKKTNNEIIQQRLLTKIFEMNINRFQKNSIGLTSIDFANSCNDLVSLLNKNTIEIINMIYELLNNYQLKESYYLIKHFNNLDEILNKAITNNNEFIINFLNYYKYYY